MQNCGGFYVIDTELSEIKYVPITSEILKKSGWKETLCEIHGQELKGFKKEETHMVLEFHNDNDSFSVFYWGEFISSVKYVHQLQHILFGLGLPSDLKV